jgi:hypothetical protein
MSESEAVITTESNVSTIPDIPKKNTMLARVSKHAFVIVGMIASFTAGYMVGRKKPRIV